MKIKNCSSADIIVINGNEELFCKAEESMEITATSNEIHIKSASKTSLFEHIVLFKHEGKDSIKGNVTYFNPGFCFNYATKISLNSTIKEINIIKLSLTIHSLTVCEIFIPKEKVETDIFFEKAIVRKLLLLFISIFAVPTCGITGCLTFISACGILWDFDWSLVVATAIFALFLRAFISISRDLYCLANPSKNYFKILEKENKLS